MPITNLSLLSSKPTLLSSRFDLGAEAHIPRFCLPAACMLSSAHGGSKDCEAGEACGNVASPAYCLRGSCGPLRWPLPPSSFRPLLRQQQLNTVVSFSRTPRISLIAPSSETLTPAKQPPLRGLKGNP